MDRLTVGQRRALRDALRSLHPWLADIEHGPASVVAGECDACGQEARMVTPCGPTSARALGRSCALAAGEQAWCDGHRDEAATALAWLAALPDEADDVARLWWVATGEVRMDSLAAILARTLPSPLPDELSDFR